MLHMILKEETAYESEMKVAVAVMLFGKESSLDHIQQRTSVGYCNYKAVEGFPEDAQEEVRINDVIAISDEFTDAEIAKIIDEYARQVPVLIISAGRAVSKRDGLKTKIIHPNVGIVDTNVHHL